MAIIEGLTNELIARLPGARDDFSTDEYRVALYGASANLGPETAGYSVDEEVSGVGYEAGGYIVEIIGPVESDADFRVGLEDIYVMSAKMDSVYGALLYNSTKAYSVCVYGCAPTPFPRVGQFNIIWNPIDGQFPPVRIT